MTLLVWWLVCACVVLAYAVYRLLAKLAAVKMDRNYWEAAANAWEKAWAEEVRRSLFAKTTYRVDKDAVKRSISEWMH